MKSRASDGAEAGLGDNEMNTSTDDLAPTLATLARDESGTKGGLNASPAMRGRGVSEGSKDSPKSQERPSKNGLDLATEVSTNKKAKSHAENVIEEVEMDTGKQITNLLRLTL